MIHLDWLDTAALASPVQRLQVHAAMLGFFTWLGDQIQVPGLGF